MRHLSTYVWGALALVIAARLLVPTWAPPLAPLVEAPQVPRLMAVLLLAGLALLAVRRLGHRKAK